MEGTRHEKIIIAIAAYVIGFSTAFIAFGVNQVNKTAPSDFSNAYISPVSAQTPVHHMETTVSLAEEGLFAISQERKRILSANRNYLEANVVEALGETGLHYAIIDAEVSPNGKFIYFCEQLTSLDDTCGAFVYSVGADTIYEVSLDSERFRPIVADHESVWNEGNLLLTEGAVSVNADVPWVMTAELGE